MSETVFDLKDARPERYVTDPAIGSEFGVPDYRATSGESGEKSRSLFDDTAAGVGKSRPGLFGGSRAGTAKPRKPRGAVPPLTSKHKKGLSNFYKFLGASIRPFDELVGETLIEQSDACASSVWDLAQENDAFRRAVLMFTTTSMTGAVVMAHLPIVLALARHSKNDRVKLTAAATFVALKMGSQAQAEEIFTPDDEPVEE